MVSGEQLESLQIWSFPQIRKTHCKAASFVLYSTMISKFLYLNDLKTAVFFRNMHLNGQFFP